VKIHHNGQSLQRISFSAPGTYTVFSGSNQQAVLQRHNNTRCDTSLCSHCTVYFFIPTCLGNPVNFTDQSTFSDRTIIFLNWQWNWGDGSGLQNILAPGNPSVSHTFSRSWPLSCAVSGLPMTLDAMIRPSRVFHLNPSPYSELQSKFAMFRRYREYSPNLSTRNWRTSDKLHITGDFGDIGSGFF